MMQAIQFFLLGQAAMTAISIVGCYLEKHSTEKAKAEAREKIRKIEARYSKQTLLLNAYRRVVFASNQEELNEARTDIAKLEKLILNQNN